MTPEGRGRTLLLDFLRGYSESFSCDALRTDLPPQPPTTVHSLQPYLFLTTGLFWRLLGVSWQSLTPLYGLLFGATACSAYGLLRLGTRRWLSLLMALLLTFSSLQLYFLPDLRDYAKVPFMLSLVFLLGCLVKWPVRRNVLLGLSAAYGVIFAIGTGFRADLFTCLLPFLVTLFFLLPGPLRANLRLKVSATAVFAAAALLAGGPALVIFWPARSTEMLATQVVGGFFQRYDPDLGVSNDVYKWGHPVASDAYRYQMVQSYAYRSLGSAEHVPYTTAGHRAASNQYLLEFLKTFPADALIRAYGSVLAVLELPFHAKDYLPEGSANPILLWVVSRRDHLVAILAGLGFWSAAAAVLLLARSNVRQGIFLAFAVLYLCAYPAMQFQPRHYFYLEFVALWAVGFVVEQAWQAIGVLLNKEKRQVIWLRLRQPSALWTPAVRNVLVFVVGFLVLALGPLYATRWYQQLHLRDLFQAYAQAEKEPLDFQIEPSTDRAGRFRLHIPDFPRADSRVSLTSGSKVVGTMSTEYLVMQLPMTACAQAVISVTTVYSIQTGPHPYEVGRPGTLGYLTHLFPRSPFDPGDDVIEAMFPIYQLSFGPGAYNQFLGLEVYETRSACVKQVKLFRVKDVQGMPLLLPLVLPPSWQRLELYQTLIRGPLDGVIAYLQRIASTPLPEGVAELDQEIGGWTLRGYQVDEHRLAMGEAAGLKIYWVPPPDVEPVAGGGFYRDDAGRWVQTVAAVKSLIPHGGFEEGDLASVFPDDIYKAAPETRRVVMDHRDEQPTHVAALVNTPAYTRTSLVTIIEGIKADHLYVQAGWLRSEGGSGYLGQRWLPVKQYEYTVAGANPIEWTHYARATEPVPPTYRIQMWLLNRGSEGTVYFDDVVFVDLGQLSVSPCQPAKSDDGPLRCGPPLAVTPPSSTQ
jgi:hypothetical protein